jgi:hypothetical protein
VAVCPSVLSGDLSFMQIAPDIATCMYYTGLDPFTKKEVPIARGLHDRPGCSTQVRREKPHRRRAGGG